MPRERATELEFLRWFWMNADFGPAHENVMLKMEEVFTKETGKLPPVGYTYETDEET